jgi:hypothetical protein
LLEAPVADRHNWTLARLIGEIEAREGVTISKSRLSKVLRKKSSAGADRDKIFSYPQAGPADYPIYTPQ